MTPKDLNRRNLLIGTALVGASVAGADAVLSRASSTRGLVMRTRAGVAFYTAVFIMAAGPDGDAVDRAIDAGFAGIRAVENASSLYRTDSEISRLNRIGRIEDASPHLLKLVTHALALAATSNGAFDPTVQPLWDVWREHTRRGARPDEETLRRTLSLVDWTGVSVQDRKIAFDRPGMALTLNSLNLGYAADVVMAILAEHGIADAMVGTGEFGSRGLHPDGRDWRLGVLAPRDPDALAFTIDPFHRFAATAGDYKTFFSPDFKDHHIFNPRTGYSPPDWSAITVLAPTGLEADGLSTALFVLDRDEGRRLLASSKSCSAHYFMKDGTELSNLA